MFGKNKQTEVDSIATTLAERERDRRRLESRRKSLFAKLIEIEDTGGPSAGADQLRKEINLLDKEIATVKDAIPQTQERLYRAAERDLGRVLKDWAGRNERFKRDWQEGRQEAMKVLARLVFLGRGTQLRKLADLENFVWGGGLLLSPTGGLDADALEDQKELHHVFATELKRLQDEAGQESLNSRRSELIQQSSALHDDLIFKASVNKRAGVALRAAREKVGE